LPGNKGIPESVPLPPRYIFIPFQVEADSQLILYSPLVGRNMDRFLSLCLDAARQVAPDCKLLVKLHPANLGQIDYGPLVKKYPDVLFQKGGSSSLLIESSQAVITVNSTVGFEALTYYKPVLTLGESLYNVAGVVYHVEAEGELPGLLAQALSQPVDRERIDRLLYYLFDDYFGHGSWKNHTANSYREVADKIAGLLSGHR
jgi:capsular polysaccharide export protein